MKRRIAATAVTLTAVMLLGGVAPAAADPREERTTTVIGMNAVGFDEAVAAANGFEIQTLPDGSQVSVPVTPEAVALLESAGVEPLVIAPEGTSAGAGEVTPLGSASVTGNCGRSSISLYQSTNSKVRMTTSYSVRLPVTTRWWSIALFGVGGFPIFPFNGGAGPASWGTAALLPYQHGGAGGFGNVTPGSYVILTDGAICYSGSPGTTF
jgi:hypothetical protein